MLSGESRVIRAPKAELYHYTADYLKKLGYEVICLNFENLEKNTCYNLLQPKYQDLTNMYWFIVEMSRSVEGKIPMSEYMKKFPVKYLEGALMFITEVALVSGVASTYLP